MRIFGLIGYPLSHSFSKKYFDHKFASEHITDANFFLYSIEKIEDVVNLINTVANLKGLAITIPYKKQIIPFLHELSPAVQKMNACNCIRIQNGYLTGFNTDVIGFKNSFIQKKAAHHTKAMILGTGGAAAAVAFVLDELNISYIYVSRNPSEVTNGIQYAEITEALMQEYSIIINTTPLGTFPDVHLHPPIPYHFLNENHYLFDLIYNPSETLFLQKGRERGCVTQNGYDMLVIQAEENWKIWNG
ncbi:MAG: shikimate dehydrogenase [Sphingobacteriales bacterium]|uniref:shikimate dehydrogenase family protein n=1 Tax=Hydrotalea flava TaxID=714549 RepID=UPI000836B2E3|nr:shikimate dehydrogenase [Hydrotalea flava]RTL51019.1 MAG: shikimate dehydrogenase [Sphingobacteriales bacterium]